jgi:uncharacterized protein (TIGR02145 family)
LKRVKINQVIYFLNSDFYMKCFLFPKLMLIAKIAMSQIMLPAYQGVVSKIPTVAVMSCPGLATVTDIDNNSYNTVLIGTQCWMASNLRVTKYNNGTIIPLDNSGGASGDGSTEWTARTSGARTVYAHNSSNLIAYGYLYNWYAATDTREICPAGWHIPSDAEWTTLTNQLGTVSVAGTVMKSNSTLWTVATPPSPGTNTSGFSALPGGYRYNNGIFDNIRFIALFWSATDFGSVNAWFRSLHNYGGFVYRDNYSSKSLGASVRCLRN